MPSGHRHGVIFFALALLLHVFLCCETMYNLVPGALPGDQGRPWTGAGGAVAPGLQEPRGPSLYIHEYIRNAHVDYSLKSNVKFH